MRHMAQVVSVQFDQIKGVEEYAIITKPVANAIEIRDPVIVAGHSFPIDDAGA